MDPWILVALLAAALALVLAGWVRTALRARRVQRSLRSSKQSQSTRYGQITEQFAPLVANWPWDSKGFRFLGTPIDGVQFNEDGIVLVEIKAAGSQLNAVQRRIRDQVAAGQVSFEVVRHG